MHSEILSYSYSQIYLYCYNILFVKTCRLSHRFSLETIIKVLKQNRKNQLLLYGPIKNHKFEGNYSRDCFKEIISKKLKFSSNETLINTNSIPVLQVQLKNTLISY